MQQKIDGLVSAVSEAVHVLMPRVQTVTTRKAMVDGGSNATLSDLYALEKLRLFGATDRAKDTTVGGYSRKRGETILLTQFGNKKLSTGTNFWPTTIIFGNPLNF